MDGWINENASAVIAAASALFAAIIAALSTFFATALSHRASKSQRDDTFEHERWKLNRDLYLVKAEEILMLFNKWYLVVYTRHQKQLEDSYLKTGMGEFYDSINDTDVETLQPKIFVLLALYYSELIPHFESIVKSSNTLNQAYIKTLTDDEENNAFDAYAKECIIGLSKECDSFIVSLAKTSQSRM